MMIVFFNGILETLSPNYLNDAIFHRNTTTTVLLPSFIINPSIVIFTTTRVLKTESVLIHHLLYLHQVLLSYFLPFSLVSSYPCHFF